MNAEAVISPHNVPALRHFHDVVESNVRTLKALGVAAETYGSLLATVLMNKLPNDLRLIIGRKIGEADWQLDTMTEQLQEIEACERACPQSASVQSNQKKVEERCHQQLPLCSLEISHNAATAIVTTPLRDVTK